MTTFGAYLEDQKRRARAALIADVFRTEGLEGLVRRGLAPDPRTDPQFQRPTLGEAAKNAVTGGGALGLGLLAGGIDPFLPEDVRRRGIDLPEPVQRGLGLASQGLGFGRFNAPERLTVGEAASFVSPVDVATLGGTAALKGGALAVKGARPVIREVGKAATSPAVRAALRDQRGAIRIPGSTPEELPLPGEVPTRALRGQGDLPTEAVAAPAPERPIPGPRRTTKAATTQGPSPAAARQAPPVSPTPVGATPAPAAGQVTPAPAPAAPPVQPAAAQGAGGTPPPSQPPVATGATPPDPIKKFAAFIHSPESLNLAEETVRVRKKQVAERATAYSEQLNTYIEQGMKMEEAQRKALEAMSGKYDRPLTTVSEDLTNEFRDSLFTRVHEVLKGEPLEEMATNEALTNALMGKGIPRIAGTKGGSAYTRLSRVFPPEVLDSLQSGKPLQQLVEERMVGAGGAKAPEETIRWTLNVPKLEDLAEAEKVRAKYRGEQIGLKLPSSVGRFAEKFYPSGPALDEFEVWRLKHGLSPDEPMPYKFTDVPRPPDNVLWSPEQGWLIPETPPTVALGPKTKPSLSTRDLRLLVQRQEIDFALPSASPTGPQGAQLTMFEAPIEKEIKQPSMVPLEHRNLIARVAKDVGLTVMDTVNLIRANKSSFDFSWWRQQFPLIFNNKRDFMAANVAGMKAMKSADFAKAAEARIKNHPYYQLYAEAGYDFLRTLDQKGLPVWQREENFLVMGGQRPLERFSEKIPWVRWSQRSFVTATNEMNWRIFTRYVDKLKADELKIAAGRMKAPEGGFSVLKEATDFAAMLSDLTGRAKLGPLKELSPALNAGLFSMRLTLGRALTPRHLFSKNPRVRVEAWKNIGSAVAVTTGVLLLGKQLGLWEVELDPRSADFMKLRIGKTRIDPWGGYQQFVVLYSRLISGQQRSSQTGRVRPTSFWETAGRFAESKESPGVGLATELLTQETYLGDKVDIKNPHQWVNRLAPMMLDDVYEAVSETGSWGAAAVAIPSALGLGTGTYNAPPELVSRAEVAKYTVIPSNDREAKAKRLSTREAYRAKHPDVDAQLFLAGDVTSLKTMAARMKALQYMRQNKLKVSDIRALEEEEYESPAKTTLRRWFQRAMGEATQTGSAQSIGPQRMTRAQELAESAARKARLAAAGAR